MRVFDFSELVGQLKLEAVAAANPMERMQQTLRVTEVNGTV